MTVKDITKVCGDYAKKVTEDFQILLADMQVYYTNLRGFHWNIRGKKFFELHKYFEDQYDAYATHIDDCAERMLQLDITPTARFSDYLKVSQIKEAECTHCGRTMVQTMLKNLTVILAKEREILHKAEEAGDTATADFISGLIDEQEKSIWMLVAYCNEGEEGSCCSKK